VPKSWHGSLLSKILPAEECRVVSLTRAGRSSLPKADDSVESGDILHLSATQEAAKALRQRLDLLREA
jgi:Trk K+ transport system NAD-binding subunit